MLAGLTAPLLYILVVVVKTDFAREHLLGMQWHELGCKHKADQTVSGIHGEELNCGEFLGTRAHFKAFFPCSHSHCQ